MRKHGFIASVLVALSLAALALPVGALAEEAAENNGAVAAYASNICSATADGKHVYNRVAELAPTCTEKGHTRGMTCSACGEVFIESTELPALGHDFTVTVDEVPATCTKAGSTSGKKCSRCDATEGITVIPATGHRMGDWETTKEPTCTEAGQKTRACQNSGCTEKETQSIDALGHEWVKKDGKTHACTRCNETEEHSFEDGKCEVCGYEKPASGGTSGGSTKGLDNVPKTGDVTPIFVYGVVVLLGAAALVIRRFRLAAK